MPSANMSHRNEQPPPQQLPLHSLVGGHGLVDMDSLRYSSEIASLQENSESARLNTNTNQSPKRDTPPHRPSKIPFPPTESNIPKLKKSIVDSSVYCIQ